ncbi:MAG: hypothetical protein EBV86_17905, partial [Marivivens sp.]|nr:hypothetical protein [Marivivens sp.]
MRLNPKQERAVEMLARGTTITEVAQVLEVSRVTVHRWTKNELFCEHLENEKAEQKVLRVATAQTTPEDLVQSLIKDAHACLSQVLTSGENERARVDAAKYVLERY